MRAYMGSFLEVLRWQLLQDVPIVVLFALAVWLGPRAPAYWPVACLLLGAVGSSLTITFTEPFKLRRVDEPALPSRAVGRRAMLQEVVGNAALFGVAGVALLGYFGLAPRLGWLDVSVGGLVGGLIGLAQFAYTTARLTVRTGVSHIGALVVAGAGVFWLFRVLQGLAWPQMLVGSLGATLLLAGLSTLLDYSFAFRPSA